MSDEEEDAAYGATAVSAGPPMPWDPPPAPAAPPAQPPPPPPAPWGDLVPDEERLDASVPRVGARPPRDTTVWRTTVAGTGGRSRRGLATLLGGVVTLAVAVGLIALLLRGNEVIAGAAPGSARLLIAAFAEGPTGAGSTLGQTTAQSIKLALDNARTPADQARLPVATVGLITKAADAQSTLNRNQAQALLWGTLPDGVHGPISATLAWRDSPRADPWQRYGATGRLLVPPSVPLPDQPLTAAQALAPALRALQNYEAGDYDAARTQAESVPADAPASTQNLAAFIRANSLIATEHAADAVPLYQALEARGWTGAALYNNWGVAALDQGDLGAARARLEQAAAQLPPGDQAAAVIVNTNRGLAALDGGDFAAAQTAFDAALKADPQAAEAALQRGYLAYRRGDGATATRDTLTALAAAPDDPAVERQLGLIQLMVRNPAQALTHFQRALALYTSWETALRAQEGASVSRADLRNATSATQRLVELNHELGTTQYYVGLAYADMARGEPPENFFQSTWRHLTGGQNDADRAIAAFQDAIRLDRDRADARYQMGLLYRANGDRSQARDAFARAQQLAPTDPNAYEALASMDEEDQQPQQAVAEYQALIAANPGYTPAYVDLAQLYQRTGDTAGAEKTNSALVAQPAHTPQEHFTHAEALAALNRPDEAAAEAQAALAGDPTMWQAHLFLANWYAQSGRQPEALAEYNAVLAQQPGNVDALYEFGPDPGRARPDRRGDDALAAGRASGPAAPRGAFRPRRALRAEGPARRPARRERHRPGPQPAGDPGV